ncbi:hypothetical protein GCM10009676_00250 [Prauserella halophila]|uniref:Sugar transport protein n=1 Tax=Prauserella halophila TaxID=185641 RepID=A0ABN1VTT4_9PSEU|nr:hypothetical protein [Prauserella halophila]
MQLRIRQGIAVGGEWGGAALMSLEHANKKRRGFAASIPEQFGTTARYTGVSPGYQLARLLGAGLTPMILTSLYVASGRDIMSVVWFLAAVGPISVVAILLTRESQDNELTQDTF